MMGTPRRWHHRSNPAPGLPATLTLLLFLLPLLPAVAQDLTQLSLTYIQQAGNAAAEGATEEARRYLDTALSLSPRLSDAHLAMGEHLSREGQHGEAITHLRAALEEGRFRRSAPDRARVLLARLEVVTRQYRSALETLEGVTIPTSESVHLRGEALLALGRLAEARRVVDRGRALYPEEVRFVALSYTIDPVPPLSLGRWLEENRSGEEAYLELYRTYLLALERPEAHAREAQEYFDLGGRDPAVAARYAALLDSGVELFLDLEGYLDKAALELAGRELPEETLSRLIEESRARLNEMAEEGESAVLVYDGDGDGIREGQFVWEAGRISRYEADPDQDGEVETRIEFGASGVPVEVSHLDGPLLSYSRYPYLAGVEFEEDEGVRSLYLRPDLLTHYVLRRRPSLYAEREDLTFEFIIDEEPPDRELLRRYAALEVVESEGVTYRRLLDGVPVIEYRDTRGEGVIEEVRVFEAGRMVHALLDPDGDGAFELYEYFGPDGVELQGVDRDMSGRSEIFAPFLSRLSRFDSDEDGLLDFGMVTDEIMSFMEMEALMRNNLAFQIEQFGNEVAP
ncbi:MAG: tetratricopeptide repeat protein [Spirochaetaceae bacterium]